jgi:hypothetical protein
VGREGELRVPRLPPDFLSSFVVPIDLMRLSLLEAAYLAVDECRLVGNPEFARDDKGEDGDFYQELSDRMDRKKQQVPPRRLVESHLCLGQASCRAPDPAHLYGGGLRL